MTKKEKITEEDLLFLSQTTLFQGTRPDEIQAMLQCLKAVLKCYPKDAILLHAGETTHVMGLVLSGSVHIENIDVWGNKSILSLVTKGQIFAETYACVPDEPMMVSATTASACTVLFLDMAHLLCTCQNSCTHHNQIIQNLLMVSARKNLSLSRRILHTSPKSIRARVISYLSDQAAREGSLEITIPFNRQQLADYLEVDRSALSNELSKMQKEGLLTINRNTFRLPETLPI